jgi:hypothetical protein
MLITREALSALTVSMSDPGPFTTTVRVISRWPLLSVMVCGVLNAAASKVTAFPALVQARTSRSDPAPESLVFVTTLLQPGGAAAAAERNDSVGSVANIMAMHTLVLIPVRKRRKELARIPAALFERQSK